MQYQLVVDKLTSLEEETQATPCSSDDMISFVEIDDVLLSHLNVERFQINGLTDEKVENLSIKKEKETEKSASVDNSKSLSTSKVSEKDPDKSSDVCEKVSSDKEEICHLDGEKACVQEVIPLKKDVISPKKQDIVSSKKKDVLPLKKQDVLPPKVSSKDDDTTTSSPDTRSSTPISRATTLPVKLQESKKDTIVKSVSASSLDKYDLKAAYGMWNIKPCSVPIQNSGASFMVGKTGILSSFRSEGRAKFQTKITDYDKYDKQVAKESKSLPAKVSPHTSTTSPSPVSPAPPSRAAVNESPENTKGSNVNITATSSIAPSLTATSSSQVLKGSEVDNVSTSASTISNVTTGSDVIKTEIKIGAVPEDCLAGLAQVSNQRRQSSCEQRSASPREAATPTSAQIAIKPEPSGQPRSTKEDPTDLPVLEKESTLPEEPVKEEKPTGVESVTEDREMPELTIEKAERGEGKKTATSQSC